MNKKGFTLAELLIVVAIIAVLSAVAIPVFTAQLSKSRLAANQANARSALAAVSASFLTDEPKVSYKAQSITYYEYAVSDSSAKAFAPNQTLEDDDFSIVDSTGNFLRTSQNGLQTRLQCPTQRIVQHLARQYLSNGTLASITAIQ